MPGVKRKNNGKPKFVPRDGPTRLQCAGYFMMFLMLVVAISSVARMLKGQNKSDANSSGIMEETREMMRGSTASRGRSSEESTNDCDCASLQVKCGTATNHRSSTNSPQNLEEDQDLWKTPEIKVSHYKRIFGQEPFQETGWKHWGLHAIPTDDWYERAKKVVDQCDLRTPDPDHASFTDETTLVTVLLDLKRGTQDNGQFQRSMQEYYSRLDRILGNKWPVVLFIPEDFVKEIHIHDDRTHIVPFDMEKLKEFFPYWDRVEEIRLSQFWQAQARAIGWLAEAPQARLKGYNPLVMAKMLFLRRAARMNPFKTKNFLFLDAGHMCATEIKPGEIPTYEEHFDKFFVTHWPYGTTTEVHGFTDKAMHMYMNMKEDPMQIVRGGIFGGQKPYIECVTQLYLIILAQTLEDGYMGTEENILAIALRRFPELFHAYDNDQRGNHGDNCASFADNLERVKDAKQKGEWQPKQWIAKYEPGQYKPGDQPI